MKATGCMAALYFMPLWALLLASDASGFHAISFLRNPSSSRRGGISATTIKPLNMIDPNQMISDPSTLDLWMQSAQSLLDSTSLWLSSDGVAPAPPTGWWGTYLSFFKNSLSLVHSTLDQPLRQAGIQQTWGISIAVYTAIIRVLLLPLSIQQSKSAEYMKVLRPYVSEIRTKFKSNQDAMNRAIGKLYEDAQQNPLAGCLLSLAQLPVFLGLYRGVRLLAQEGQLEEPFLWIPSLEGPVSPPDFQGLDWLLSGWTTSSASPLPVPALGWEMTLAFLVMPLILVVLQTVTMQALQPPVDDSMSEEERETIEKSQAIFKFLPLLIGFFSLQVPAGLTIYWFASNLFTLSQSLAVRAYFAANPPKIELPDYWDTALAENADYDKMSPEERRKAAEAGIRVGPTIQELIDEARFHSYIRRDPLRAESDTWKKIVASASPSNVALPAELEAWVKSAGVVQPATVAVTPKE